VDPSPLQRTVANSFAPVVDRVSPSVVTVSTKANIRSLAREMPDLDPWFRRFFGLPDEDGTPSPRRRGPAMPETPERNRRVPTGLGSGVIVSTDGYIITNNHVIENGDEILVTLANSETEIKARKIGADPGSDIAVLKIDGTNHPAATFADSEQVRVGDMVIAIGNPFALRQSVTTGIVSAVGRKTRINEFENFIQTDASINPGNSGGALVDTEGRLVGINTAIFSRSGGNQGIGFAIPANQARQVMESLVKYGKVSRGYLGVEMQNLDDTIGSKFGVKGGEGVLVANVVPGGAAANAGVEAGDVIVSVDGRGVKNPDDLKALVAGALPGSKVTLKLLRDGKQRDIAVTLMERPTMGGIAKNEPSPTQDPDVLDGVTVGDIDEESRKEFGIPEGITGALVLKLDSNSASAAAGIKAGDVIHEINRKQVKNAEQAVKASEEVKKEKSVLLRVSTKGASRYVVVTEGE
jgi:serine protease Do